MQAETLAVELKRVRKESDSSAAKKVCTQHECAERVRERASERERECVCVYVFVSE